MKNELDDIAIRQLMEAGVSQSSGCDPKCQKEGCVTIATGNGVRQFAQGW